jgi:hypothetical protein
VFTKKDMYKDQIDRLERIFRFVTLDERFKDLDDPMQRDIILSFFMHCWHLSDWLARSEVVAEDDVFGYSNNVYELQVCRNITVGTKHLENRKPSPPKLFDHKMKEFPPTYAIYRDYDYLDNSPYWVLHVDDNLLRRYDFMERCIHSWNNFLEMRGLEKLKI